MWTFIADQDLENGRRTKPGSFGKIMKKLKTCWSLVPFFVLIWQSKQAVWAMISFHPDRSVGAAKEKLTASLSAKKKTAL